MATVVIVGSNRGIGLALVKAYVAKGFPVIGTCRTASPELEATGATVLEGIDMTSDESALRLQSALVGKDVSLAVINAGILSIERIDAMDLSTIEHQLQVNSIGPLRMALALLPSLQSGSKLGFITSRMGSMTDNTSGSAYGYRMSKAALNMAGVSLSLDVADLGVAVALIHPGYVRTDMTGGNGLISTTESAEGIVARMNELRMETSGSFWHAQGEPLPW